MSSQPENPQYDTLDPNTPGDGPHEDEPTGPPYRAIAMVLLAAVVLAIGIGLVQLFGGDDDDEPATSPDQTTSQVEPNGQEPADQPDPDGEPTPPALPGDDPEGTDPQAPADPADPDDSDGQPPAEAPAGGQAAGGPDVTAVPVQVYNNSTVTGLAARTGETLRENGYAVGDVANMPSNRGVVSESTAFYGTGAGEQQAAEAIAGQLGIVAAPRPADMAGDAPGVIVIVTQDLDR